MSDDLRADLQAAMSGEPAPEPEAAPEKEAPEAQAEAPPVEPQAPEIPPPPASWPKEWHPDWQSLDPNWRQRWQDQDKKYHAGVSEHGARRAQAERQAQEASKKAEELTQWKQRLEPYSWAPDAIPQEVIQQWTTAGIPPDMAVKQMIAVRDQLRRDPVQGLLGLARDMGVDLRQVVQQGYQPPDPAHNALMTEVQQLKARLAEQDRAREEAQRAEQDRQNEQSRQIAAKFIADKKLTGDQVGKIAKFVRAGMTLDEAYDAYTAIDPASREQERKRLTDEAREQERTAEADRLAKRAAAAQSDTTGHPSEGATAPHPDRSLRETLSEAFRAAS